MLKNDDNGRRSAKVARGRPPYGYRLHRTTDPDGHTTTTWQRDEVAAPVVRRIFDDYVAGNGLHLIAESLTTDGILCPSAHDRVRNPQFGGVAWSKGAVRAILINPRYARLDGDDAAPHSWQPIINGDLFGRAQETLARKHAKRGRAAGADRHYRFRGVLHCGYCHRIMQGTWNNDEPYYRCRFPENYATANGIAHPRNVYLRERRLLGPLHRWLATSFTQPEPEEALRSLNGKTPLEQARLYQRLRLKLIYLSGELEVRARIVVAPAGTTIRGMVAL